MTAMTMHERRVAGAFKLAMYQLGAPVHPGPCPDGCPHPGWLDPVSDRAEELLAGTDLARSGVCAAAHRPPDPVSGGSCGALIPAGAWCYTADGLVLCERCATLRGLPEGYRARYAAAGPA